MIRTLSYFLCLWLSISHVALADETVRQVQEELRKRNLYFGNIDGQTSPVLVDALKRYQTRKGFTVTGKVDADTATSLHVQATPVGAATDEVAHLATRVMEHHLERRIRSISVLDRG